MNIIKKLTCFTNNKIKLFFIIITLLLLTVLSVIFIAHTYEVNIKETEHSAISLAEAAQAGISKTHLFALSTDETDIDKPEYKEIKSNLINVTKLNNNIRFAYILVLKEDAIYLAADSEPVDSADYSPPGQKYTEAGYIYYGVFKNSGTALTSPATDRRGTCISVLVPMKDAESGDIIAVFGVDYPAENWYNDAINRTVQPFMIVLSLFIIIVILYFVFRQNKELRGEKAKLLESEVKLKESEHSKSVLLSNIPGIAYKCKYDRDRTMEFVSEGCYTLTGYKPESLLNNKNFSYDNLIPPEYREYIWNKRTQAVEEKSRFTEEYEIITATGDKKWVWEQGQGIYDESGHIEALEGLIVDITDRKNHEIKLNHINYHDQLTNLYNRKYFEYLLTRDLSDYSETKKAVLLVNVRKFSLLNITYGYTFCENLIRELACQLMLFTNDKCVLFHISIDRFILYMNEYEEKNNLTDLCKSILVMLNKVLTPKIIGANIGIVEIGSRNRDAEDIIKNASIAAENVGMNQNFGYSFYNISMAEKADRENEIKNELADAAFNIDNDNMFMLYQPILDLKTNVVSGFEALARFRSNKFGVVSPLEFIPIAEETQLIVPLGKQIMRLVCRAVKKIEIQYPEPFIISFNVSIIQLLRDDFITDLTEIIEETDVNPGKLVIELTESVFSDNYDVINDKLDIIRESGIKISIDDFGTGYSSLARERELNTDYLKIDKHFIDKLLEYELDKTITSDIILMGHKLGHCVIAEGVEYEKQKEYLILHNCDKMQGYLFGVPLTEEIAIKFLQNNRAETDTDYYNSER